MTIAGPARLRSLDRLLAIAEAARDERRAELARLVQATDEAAVEEAAHAARIVTEWAAGSSDPQAALGFEAWLRAAQTERQRLRARRAGLQRSEQAAREALREALAETKRLEVLSASQRRGLRKQAERRGQALADDAETTRFARRGAPA